MMRISLFGKGLTVSMRVLNDHKIFLYLLVLSITSCNGYNEQMRKDPVIRHIRVTKIIAHRGYWKAEGAYENSIKALESAAMLGADGTEFDIWLTKDDSVVVNHDAVYAGKTISKTKYSELVKVRLPNGEKLPTLREYLRAAKKYPDLILFLEIHEERMLPLILHTVISEELKNEIVFTSFLKYVCERLHTIDRSLTIVPLHPLPNYASIHDYSKRFKGIAFSLQYFKAHEDIIDEAIDEGMMLATWTVGGTEVYDWFYDHHFNYIITDNPNVLVNHTIGNEKYWHDEVFLK